MEADWEFELGGDSPLIDAAWSGFVDLRLQSQDVDRIAEVSQLAGLASALIHLNAESSPVWTSKCDIWCVDKFDPDELDAPREFAVKAVACYIDMLPKSDQMWESPGLAEKACRALCDRLRTDSLRACRADFVIRTARVMADKYTLGMTAYLTACGPTEDSAHAQLSSALAALVESVRAQGTGADAPPQLQ